MSSRRQGLLRHVEPPAGDTVVGVDKMLYMQRTPARTSAPATGGAERRPRAKA